MSKSSTVTVGCTLCVGAEPERYLAAALDAIAPCVDLLAVNDNSGLARSANVATLEASAFAARGSLHVARSAFVDFADMRDRALAALEAAGRPDWVLFLDADEVHGAQLRYIVREVLPSLSADVGHLDAYTYDFFGTFRWIAGVARRFVLHRLTPGLRFENRVHERIVGLAGGALVVPYVYHHYGNVLEPAALARKHGRYFALGNAVPPPPSEDDATDGVYVDAARTLRRYRGAHPVAARALLARLERERAGELAALDYAIAAARGAPDHAGAGARTLNEWLRVELRRVEHPLRYRAATRAR